MQRFKNILVVHNSAVGDEAMLARATAIAKGNRAQLTVTTVLEEPGADVRKTVVEERRQHFERLIASVRHDGIQAKATVPVGTPFLEITREVLRGAHGLLMMTAEGLLGMKKLMFGSTSMHLMRKCPCPIWLVKPGSRRPTKRILAAVAPDPFNRERDALNTTIMDLANSLAEREQAELHVVHVWNVASDDRLRWPSGVTKVRQNEWHRRVREHHKTALFNLLDAYKKDIPAVCTS